MEDESSWPSRRLRRRSKSRTTSARRSSDHAERVESVFAEMAKLEEKGLEQAAAQLDEADAPHQGLARVRAASSRRSGASSVVDAARRTAEMVSGPGAA